MSEWKELRAIAHERLAEVLEERSKLNQRRSKLIHLTPETDKDEMYKDELYSIGKKFTSLMRKECVIRGQLTVLNRVLNEDYPFEIGEVLEAQLSINRMNL